MQNSDSGCKDRAIGLPDWPCPSLLQHRPGAFLSLQDYMEMPASKAGSLASLKGSKPVKNKNLFGDKSHFINKNISVPEGPDVSKTNFQF